jgi:hypothetical protein
MESTIQIEQEDSNEDQILSPTQASDLTRENEIQEDSLNLQMIQIQQQESDLKTDNDALPIDLLEAPEVTI